MIGKPIYIVIDYYDKVFDKCTAISNNTEKTQQAEFISDIHSCTQGCSAANLLAALNPLIDN